MDICSVIYGQVWHSMKMYMYELCSIVSFSLSSPVGKLLHLILPLCLAFEFLQFDFLLLFQSSHPFFLYFISSLNYLCFSLCEWRWEKGTCGWEEGGRATSVQLLENHFIFAYATPSHPWKWKSENLCLSGCYFCMSIIWIQIKSYFTWRTGWVGKAEAVTRVA